jgi:hypothetical protein
MPSSSIGFATTVSAANGTIYQICWSTEAAQQVLAPHIGTANPSNPCLSFKAIIRLLRLAEFDFSMKKANAPYLWVFLSKSKGVAYEVFANLFPAATSDQLPRCEVIRCVKSTLPAVLATVA